MSSMPSDGPGVTGAPGPDSTAPQGHLPHGRSDGPGGRDPRCRGPKSAWERRRTKHGCAARPGEPGGVEPGGCKAAADEATLRIQCDPQHAAQGEVASRVEDLVSPEVAHRVRDQPPTVELHAAQDVRSVADHEVGTGIHDRPREGHHVAARLAEVALWPGHDARAVGALGTGVHRDDDDVGALGGVTDQCAGPRDVEEALRPRVGGEPQHGHANAVHAAHGDLAWAAGVADPSRAQGADRVGPACLAEVVGVVVGHAHDVEAGEGEVAGVVRRRSEGEAVRAPGAALRGAP